MALENYRNDMLRCTRCSCCKFIPLLSILKSKRFAYNCPAVSRYNFHAYSGSGKLISALSLLEGRIDYSDRLLHMIYNCMLCGSCDLSCRIGTQIELWEILHELRVKCFADGKAPLPEHQPILQSIADYDNVWLQPRSRRTAWAKGLGIRDLGKGGEKARVLYFAGCNYSFDPALVEVARTTASLFTKADLDFGILGKAERCCASPAYMIGDTALYERYARDNIEQFNRLGVETVVTSCAGCYGIFKSKYPRLGIQMDFEVLHAVELLDRQLKEGSLIPKKEAPMKVTYHDPCHLGRLSEPREASEGRELHFLGTLTMKEVDKVLGFGGIFDAPRDVIRSVPGVSLVEMERVREYSWCCGSGAGVKSAFPDFALWTARERLAEARSSGAEALVTCCPWCQKNLSDGAAELDEPMPVVDAVGLLARSITD